MVTVAAQYFFLFKFCQLCTQAVVYSCFTDSDSSHFIMHKFALILLLSHSGVSSLCDTGENLIFLDGMV